MACEPWSSWTSWTSISTAFTYMCGVLVEFSSLCMLAVCRCVCLLACLCMMHLLVYFCPVCMCVVVTVRLDMTVYTVEEGRSVEVCVEVETGVLQRATTVQLSTMASTATGKQIMNIPHVYMLALCS